MTDAVLRLRLADIRPDDRLAAAPAGMFGMRRIWAIAILSCVSAAADARDLEGRFGYLGEWDVAASLTEERAGRSGAGEFSGALRLRHNAVCGPGETPEKSGHIRMSVRGDRYIAQMTLADSACSFSGTLSPSAHVFVRCGGEGQIPLRLWFK